MAILKDGANGGFSGKAGSVVGYKRICVSYGNLIGVEG